MKDFAQKILADVSANKVFVLHHRNTTKHIKNLIDLRLALEDMQANEYSHHVTNEKNDFATWVDNAVQDDKLAHDIAGNVSLEHMVTKVSNRIDFAVDIIEKENQKLLDDELKRLEKLPQKSTKQKDQISMLEDDIKRIAKNISLESKARTETADPKKETKETKAPKVNSRSNNILEFAFGLVIGLIVGFVVAKMILPL
jgi:hypothetical protein